MVEQEVSFLKMTGNLPCGSSPLNFSVFRLLEMKVREMQKKHKDFKGWYYDPYDIIGEEKANYFRKLNRSQWGRNDEF